MKFTRKYAIVGGAILALAAGGTGVALAVGGGDEEQATGPGADRAEAAALEITGGGTVDGVEQEGSGYEVEVTTPDGQRLEIALDDQYREVGRESESGEDESAENESAEDESGAADYD
jgi:Peptidase propeptide and YPEB domain